MFWMWAGFVAFVLTLMSLDIYVFHRRSHAVGVTEALVESAIWVALAFAFSGFIYLAYEHHWHGLGLKGLHHPNGANGGHAVVLFLTGYLIEESLSVDNLFVMSVVFGYFAIPAKYQHRVLFWGIVGAQAMRGNMILLGAAVISRFQWVLYGFGVFLLYTAWKMLYSHVDPSPKNNLILKFARRNLPVTEELHGPDFFVQETTEEAESESRNPGAPSHESRSRGARGSLSRSRERRGSLSRSRERLKTGDTTPSSVSLAAAPVFKQRWMLTPLALALLMVETTDLLFAFDSIPATFGVTTDPFLVFTSNIFAVLGLRAMYFALAGVLRKFRYLSVSLAAILAVVGVKMLGRPFLHSVHHLTYWTFGVVVLLLAAGVIASVIAARKTNRPKHEIIT
jgi:tellurite resistance protein TerC